MSGLHVSPARALHTLAVLFARKLGRRPGGRVPLDKTGQVALVAAVLFLVLSAGLALVIG